MKNKRKIIRKIASILAALYLISVAAVILPMPEYIVENPSIIIDPPKDAWLAKKYTAYNQGGKKTSSYCNYKYDINGMLIEQSGVGRQTYKHDYVYDKNKLLKQKTSNIDEMSIFITNYYYNDKNKLIRTEWGEENKIDFVVKYKYNNAGKVVEEGRFSNGVMESVEKFYYNSKNLSEKSEFIYGEKGKVASTRYFKYTDGGYLAESHMVSDTAEEYTEYIYDKNMKLQEEKLLSETKALIHREVYKYDMQKRLKEIKTYDENGELMFIVKYEY